MLIYIGLYNIKLFLCILSVLSYCLRYFLGKSQVGYEIVYFVFFILVYIDRFVQVFYGFVKQVVVKSLYKFFSK